MHGKPHARTDLPQPRAGSHDAEAAKLVADYLEEAADQRAWNSAEFKVQSTEGGRKILDLSAIEQLAVVYEAVLTMRDAADQLSGLRYHTWNAEGRSAGLSANLRHERAAWLLSRLLRKRLPHTETGLAAILKAVAEAGDDTVWHWPMGGILKAAECFSQENGLSPDLRKALEALRHGRLEDFLEEAVLRRIGRLLNEGSAKIVLDNTPFGLGVAGWVKAQDAAAREAWIALIDHAQTADNKAKPAVKWLNAAETQLAAADAATVAGRLNAWLEDFVPDPRNPAPSTNLMKGLIWMAPLLGNGVAVARLGRFCEACYKKVPGVGPANVKLGNACIYALGTLASERAAAELVRLRSRIKFNQGRKQLDKAVEAAAEASGVSPEELEEVALPDFGLGPDGCLQVPLGDCAAEIRVAGSDQVTVSWSGADGKPRKTVPAAVKTDHGETLKELRATVKEIKGLLSGQRWRLESLYLQNRHWQLDAWRRRYLQHPLLSSLSRRLIWRFTENGQSRPTLPVGDGLIGADGQPVDWPAAGAEVALWHPLDAAPDEVLAWRERLQALEITQPFKQAHREVYLLTEAERRTEIYSNRFAAHILKQHQLNALCQARGWHYALQGAWDQPESVPTRLLSQARLQAQFWIDPVEHELYTDVGVYFYMATDQVRFLDQRDQALHLSEVPPLVFSEVMRDIDLFVGVASVANDPTWQDGGPEGRHRDYWWGYSFGDLTETAKTRRAVLEALVPKLKIAERCTLEERYLSVRGTRRAYRIHLGSGNILMEPNDQYLCIVKGWDKTGKEKVRLPFEGDATLSLILSKAFLLAEDDKITDETILSQIGR